MQLLQGVQHGQRLYGTERDVRLFVVRSGPPDLCERLFLPLWLTAGD
jgi:hypothetical protein